MRLFFLTPLLLALLSPTTLAQSLTYTNTTLFALSILNATNFYRTEHNATSLTWNTTLTSSATSWASKCNFEHSGGSYGENLVAGAANATAAVEVWGLEREKYDFGNPGFSETTGHFTQLVWKA